MVLAGLVGWLLIVGGVAGECVFEVFVSRVDGQIQTFDNIQLRATERQVVEATKEAGTARSSAETAANAAFGAVTMARDTRREAESFDHQIAKAEGDAEKALARISDAVTKAETAADKADQIS